MKKLYLITLLFLALPAFSTNKPCAETPKVFVGANADQLIKGAAMIREGRGTSVPSYIKFREGEELPLATVLEWMSQTFKLPNDYGFLMRVRSAKDVIGMVHTRYQQTYKGNTILGGDWVVHSKGNKVVSMNGVVYNEINLPGGSALTEADALQRAMDHIGATTYKWQLPKEEAHIKWEQKNANATYFPKGKLIYAPKDGNFKSARNYKLCWQFNVYAHKPMSRADIYVDAISGEIVFTNDLIHHADVLAQAETQYSGIKTIIADDAQGPYRLRETGRGNGIETYDLNNTSNYGNAVDFTDNNNYWANYNAQLDEYATDAHLGTEMTYDYFWLIHNRNSIDDNGFALLSYVHYNTNYYNAFWDGQRMTYGDGNGSNITPLTTLDICGHEVTHGLTSNTSSLIYSYESGALNESFSDIFGTCVEWYGDSINPDWLIGEDIGNNFRSMSNPKSKGDPDCYLGTNWYTGSGDNGGVHTNSGVQNKWFHILTMGETGTNDNNNNYSVTGIGIIDASRIAFRNNTVYLTPSSQYTDARFYAITAATDLFGACSPEVVATADAWYAVCVGAVFNANVTASFSASATTSCNAPFTLTFDNQSVNASNYYWDFGDGNTSTQQFPTHTYNNAGQYTVTLIVSGNCGSDTLVLNNYIDITLPVNPTTVDDQRCGAGIVNLSASGSSILAWYDQQTGGNQVNTGNTYSPNIAVTTSWWVEDQIPSAPGYVGPVDNNIGNGLYYTGNRHLLFDVFSACTLVSVWVDAGSSGNRTVELRDNQGNVLQSATINIPSGQGRINLNFSLNPGTDYQLGILGTNNDLYRNSTGANYPYTLNGLVEITGCNAPNTYYYHYYDWEIVEDTCFSAREEVQGIIEPAPSVQITGDTAICLGDTVTLNANGNNVLTYSWNTGATTMIITDVPTNTTTYTVTATGDCDTVTQQFTVTVLSAPPTAAFTQNAIGLQVTFTDQSTNATSWSWNFGDSNTSNQQNPVHTYSSAGTYTVTLIATGPCGIDTIATNVTVAVGVPEIANLNGLHIYPNPTRNVLNLQFTSLEKQDIELHFMSAIGQLLFSETINGFAGEFNRSYDLNGFASGVYLLQIRTGAGILTKRIIIE